MSSGDEAAGLPGRVLEPLHDQGDHHVPLLLRELLADRQQHEHVVAVYHSHSVQVAQHVRTGYPTLDIEGMGPNPDLLVSRIRFNILNSQDKKKLFCLNSFEF